MYDMSCMKNKIKFADIFRNLKYKIQFNRNHPDYFDADGLVMFCGCQGSGKTLTAVNYTYNLMEKYPRCKLVTNIHLKDFPMVSFDEFKRNNLSRSAIGDNEIEIGKLNDTVYQCYLQENRVFPFVDNDDLSRFDNDEYGVIFLIDEIQLYMNSLQSKNINMDTMAQISQQRKQRKHIVATSQVFGRIAKPLREQFSNVVLCKCYLKMFQFNSLIDRDSIGDSDNSTATNITGQVKRKFFYIHSPIMYKRYDTSYVIQKGKFDSGKGDIYDTGRISDSVYSN